MRRRTAVSALAVLAMATAPLVAQAATPSRSLAFGAKVLRDAGGEPNVAISPSGRIVLADGLSGGNDPAALYRSTDGGKTYTRLHPKLDNVGGGDWDMHFLNERTVIAVDLSLGAGIYVDVSRDAGTTWTQSTIAMDVYDRPWVGGHGENLYVVAKGFDAVPYVFLSNDLGATFGAPIPLYGTGALPAEAGGTSPTPTEALVTNQNAYVDNLTVDEHTGDVYVLYGIDSPQTYSQTKPLGTPSRLYVAHLEAGPAGTKQMVSHPVYLGGAGDAFYAGFNWMAVDQAGTLYVSGNGLHKGHQSAFLSYSKDKGKTWSPLIDVGTPKVASVYAAIAGGAKGTLSLVYLEGTKTDPNVAQNWYATMARITAADTAKPVVQRVRAVPQAIHTKDICLDGILCGLPGFGDNRDLLDYIDNAVGPDGTAWAVVPSDGPATGNGSTSVIVLRQSGGPSHGKGVAS
ncbi:MAG: Sortilin, neurotensin receptor 3 [Frankiaceae bacterium]|nr:Sortilin, neurotensin receptor 3 [Frankiaceae bacterium]